MLRKVARVMSNVLTVLSLLLCVGVCVLWWRSFRVTDRAGWASGSAGAARVEARAEVVSDDGGLRFSWSRDGHPRPSGPGLYRECDAVGVRWEPLPESGYLGRFSGEFWDHPGGESRRGVGAPHWLVALLACAPPARRLLARRRRLRRLRLGLCHACGYDLRATPGRCPECGAEAAAR